MNSRAMQYAESTIGDYLRNRLMPVEGAIPHIPGIEMYGQSTSAGPVGGDLFEYINFQQRYDIAYSQCMYSKGNQVPGYTYNNNGQNYVAPPPPPTPPQGGE